MDNYLELANRSSDYFLTLANIEAQQLYSIASHASLIHLKDGFTRLAFIDEVKAFIDAQLNTLRSATSDDERQEGLQNLKKEREYVAAQEQMLRCGQAALYASVQFTKNDKVWGYIINGVGVVLGGLQILAGVGVLSASLATGTIIGVGFGAMLMLHGTNSILESGTNLANNTDDSQGFLRKGYLAGAEFFGFDQKTGELVYSATDLILSAYGMFRLVTKPQTYRLFYYLNTDYVRGIKNMTRFDLGVEIYNDTRAVKSIHDKRKQN